MHTLLIAGLPMLVPSCRSIECRMVKPAEYDCEPILTPDEVSAL